MMEETAPEEAGVEFSEVIQEVGEVAHTLVMKDLLPEYLVLKEIESEIH